MLSVDNMNGISGGFITINFGEHLSDQGKIYFKNSLQALSDQVQKILACKMQDTSNNKIACEIQDEMQAALQERLACNVYSGPMSLIQLNAHQYYIQMAMNYLDKCDKCVDTDLYLALNNQDTQIPDIYVDNKSMQGFFECRDAVDDTLSQEAIVHIFELFRIAQYDLLQPVEKEILLCDIKNSLECIPDNHVTFSMSAIMEVSEDERDYSHMLNKTVPEIMQMQIKDFLHFHEDVSQCEDRKDAFTFMKMHKYLQQFEFIQILSYTVLNEEITYDQLVEGMEDGSFRSFFPISKFTEYFEENKDARLPISYPDDSDDVNGKLFSHDDFTHVIYNREFSEDGRKSFDCYLQSQLNLVAAQENLPQISIANLRLFKQRNVEPLIGLSV